MTTTARGQALGLAEPGARGHQTGEEEGRGAEHDQRPRVIHGVRRAPDHELVADRDENDSRHDREVQVGVDIAADLPSLLGGGRAHPLQDTAGDLAEEQPPERRR